MLKIDIFLRRRNITEKKSSDNFRLGAFEFDYPNLALKHIEISKTLTQREADLLKFLIENKNKVLKRSDILERIWGEDDYFLGRSLDVFISRLRKYLKLDETIKIENIHGVGFRFKT
jgi:DNA-binding response OmpR family regulator